MPEVEFNTYSSEEEEAEDEEEEAEVEEPEAAPAEEEDEEKLVDTSFARPVQGLWSIFSAPLSTNFYI